jgi:glycosyltransferase involved in cell wall biosynthesis
MKNTDEKPRIALLGMEILGGGKSGEGIPALIDLFSRLSSHYEIVFYCFQRINKSKVPAAIKVRHVMPGPFPGRMKFFLLMLRMFIDHWFEPVALTFAVSAYPTGKWAVIIGKIIKRPVVVQYIALEAVALNDIGQGNLIFPWLRKITKVVSEKADVLVTVADYQKKVAQESLPTDRDIVVLPLRINHEKFVYKQRSISFPVQFIHIAYYSPIKDQDTMFRAFAKISHEIDCHLTVIGEGFDTQAVQTMLGELGILQKITFTGYVKHADVPRYLDNAHILFHTARFETGCAVIQEAMASGVAVAGTRVGILSDIGDQYAVIVAAGDAADLAKKTLDLVHNKEWYTRMTQTAYKWISTYNAAWSAENYNDFIRSVIRGK